MGDIIANDGRVMIDVMVGRRRILLIRIHPPPPPQFLADVGTTIDAITIADGSMIQTTRVLALTNSNTDRGRSQAIMIIDINHREDVMRGRILHHEGTNIVTDTLDHAQDLVHHQRRNDLCHTTLHDLLIEDCNIDS